MKLLRTWTQRAALSILLLATYKRGADLIQDTHAADGAALHVDGLHLGDHAFGAAALVDELAQAQDWTARQLLLCLACGFCRSELAILLILGGHSWDCEKTTRQSGCWCAPLAEDQYMCTIAAFFSRKTSLRLRQRELQVNHSQVLDPLQ